MNPLSISETMETRIKIKVCGMRDAENLEKVCRLRPDMVGFIFYSGSKRYIGDDPDPVIFDIPGKGIEKVGVFVNERPETVERIFRSYRLELVQLHGDESPGYCSRLVTSGIPVIKAMDPARISEPGLMESYAGSIRRLLFDTPGKGYGGTGRRFDWNLLRDYRVDVPFLLGGGIGPDDAKKIQVLEHPHLAGIDVNSRFEVEPGVKDVSKLDKFIDQIRKGEL